MEYNTTRNPVTSNEKLQIMWQYIILGIVQGLFEWIPISSEGIVALASKFLLIEFNPIDLALFLHLGTLLAVIFYFKKDWKGVVFFKDSKLARFLIISTMISLMVGYPVYKMIRSAVVGSGLLLIMGFGLLLTACFHKLKKTLKIRPDKLAIITGFLQGLAVIPGLSRSGSTIFGLSLSKITPSQALKTSYMMSVPVIFVSSTYLFLTNPSLILNAWPSLIFSFLFGVLSLRFLMNMSQKIDFFKFALIFSILCFIGAAIECLV